MFSPPVRGVKFRPFFVTGFSPTVRVDASTTSAGTKVPLVSQGTDLLVQNVGAELAFLRWGEANVANASTADFPVPPGASVIVDRMGATHVSAVTGAGTTTLYFTSGSGG